VKNRKVNVSTELEEKWVECPGYPSYEVSNHGRLKRIRGAKHVRIGRILKPWKDRKGYWYYSPCEEGKATNRSVHDLVAIAFIGPKPKSWTVNHKDLNKANNHADNLEYMTNIDNIRHGFENGAYANVGHSTRIRWNAKLTKETTEEIFALIGTIPQKDIAKRFQVSKQLVSFVKQKRTRYSRDL
jgi:hypothetical protein